MKIEKIIKSLEEELGTERSSFIITSENGEEESSLLSTRAGAIELALVLLKQVQALDEKQENSNWNNDVSRIMMSLIDHPFIVGSYIFKNYDDMIKQLKLFNKGNGEVLNTIENDPEI